MSNIYLYFGNPFRFMADMLHLSSMIILLHKLYTTRSCAGVSVKTKMLYLIVFMLRYLDILWNWANLYNLAMKILYLGLTGLTVYVILGPLKASYDKENDTFRLPLVLIAAAIVGTIVSLPNVFFGHGLHYPFTFRPFELLWGISIVLEAVSILPQLLLLARTHEIESFTSSYIACLGSYRALYIVNWIYKAIKGQKRQSWFVYVAGIVQTALYADFFYYYFKAKLAGTRMKLPE